MATWRRATSTWARRVPRAEPAGRAHQLPRGCRHHGGPRGRPGAYRSERTRHWPSPARASRSSDRIQATGRCLRRADLAGGKRLPSPYGPSPTGRLERPHRPLQTGQPPRGARPACWRAAPGFRSRATRRQQARRRRHESRVRNPRASFLRRPLGLREDMEDLRSLPVREDPGERSHVPELTAQGDGSVRTSRRPGRGRSRRTAHSRSGCELAEAIACMRASVRRARRSTSSGSRCRRSTIPRCRARERRSSRVIGGWKTTVASNPTLRARRHTVVSVGLFLPAS